MAAAIAKSRALRPRLSATPVWSQLAARKWPHRSDFVAISAQPTAGAAAAAGSPVYVVGGRAEPNFELRLARTKYYQDHDADGRRVFNNREPPNVGQVTERPPLDVAPVLSDVWSSTDGESWSKQTDAGGWSPRLGFAAVAQGQSLWLVGGREPPGLAAAAERRIVGSVGKCGAPAWSVGGVPLEEEFPRDLWFSENGGETWSSFDAEAREVAPRSTRP